MTPTSINDMFVNLRLVHAVCPHCDMIVGADELNLRHPTGSAEQTWLDDFGARCEKYESRRAKYEAERNALLEKAREAGRSQVSDVVNNMLTSGFTGFGYAPRDVRVVMDPVDFVVFPGMGSGSVQGVELVTRKAAAGTRLAGLHEQIGRLVSGQDYDWKTLRVDKADGRIEYE